MGRLSARRAGVAVLALALALQPSCSHIPDDNATVVHVVKPGENLYRIARHYDVSIESVVRANDIDDVRNLRAGARLRIPAARRSAPDRALRPPGSGGAEHPQAQLPPPSRDRALRSATSLGLEFAWPVRGRLTSRFGRRYGRRHEGIDLAQRQGTPVRAAEQGRVIYSGRGLGAYGNVVIVRHPGDYATVYAHNRRNRVREGARVSKGQVIAELGASGNASGPHVHFEIRHRDEAHDPLLYLP